MEQESKKRFLVNVAFFVVAIGLILFASKFLLGYLFPFVIGGILAFLVQRPARFISAHFPLKTGTWAAILVAVLYIAVMGIMILLLWQLLSQALGLVSSLPEQLSGFVENIDKLAESFSVMAKKLPPEISDTVMSALKNVLGGIVSALTAFFSRFAATVAGNLPAYFFSAIITIVASCYIAKDFEHLKRFLKSLIKEETFENIKTIKNIMTESVLKFVLGYAILSLITFAELVVGFLILDIRYGIIIAAVTAFIDILPVLGSGTVLLPWAVVCFVSGDFVRGVGLCIIYVLVLVIRYFAEPRIIGSSIGINPLLTLITLFLGLRLGGVGGMLLFPVVCIVVINYYKRQLHEEKGVAQKGEDA